MLGDKDAQTPNPKSQTSHVPGDKDAQTPNPKPQTSHVPGDKDAQTPTLNPQPSTLNPKTSHHLGKSLIALISG